MANYADFQIGLYFAGLGGELPAYPLTFAGLEAAAREKMEHRLWDYVAGGAGDEHTQRANVEAFGHWGILPRMLAGAAERDISVELFGHTLPTPLLMSPIGVLGVMTDDEHGDLAAAGAGVDDAHADALGDLQLDLILVDLGDLADQAAIGHRRVARRRRL